MNWHQNKKNAVPHFKNKNLFLYFKIDKEHGINYQFTAND